MCSLWSVYHYVQNFSIQQNASVNYNLCFICGSLSPHSSLFERGGKCKLNSHINFPRLSNMQSRHGCWFSGSVGKSEKSLQWRHLSVGENFSAEKNKERWGWERFNSKHKRENTTANVQLLLIVTTDSHATRHTIVWFWSKISFYFAFTPRRALPVSEIHWVRPTLSCKIN